MVRLSYTSFRYYTDENIIKTYKYKYCTYRTVRAQKMPRPKLLTRSLTHSLLISLRCWLQRSAVCEEYAEKTTAYSFLRGAPRRRKLEGMSTGVRYAVAALALAALLAPASAFYLPGVAPQDYARVRALRVCVRVFCVLINPNAPNSPSLSFSATRSSCT